MPKSKRLIDLVLATVLATLALPVLLVVICTILLHTGPPVFHKVECMKAPGKRFQLWKLRTMQTDPNENGCGVTGGDKKARITNIGRILRKFRIDELPQLYNVLAGDMSLVGPRPPQRYYAEMFPDLYNKVLRNRPGITGLATLVFHRHEEGILAACKTAEETDQVYQRRCMARKAKLDLIYQRHRSNCFDLVLLLRTFLRVARSIMPR